MRLFKGWQLSRDTSNYLFKKLQTQSFGYQTLSNVRLFFASNLLITQTKKKKNKQNTPFTKS